MRTSITSRYEQTLSRFLTILSFDSFLVVILLFVTPILSFGSLILALIVVFSSILIIRTFYLEQKQETFDITSHTLFETGLLVFPSRGNRCAIFFAFNISNTSRSQSRTQRALTILLKVLPSSTIIAVEWTSEKQCFISFYIKLEKSSFLNRASELLDNIQKSLTKTLGSQSNRLLSGAELTSHFSMGIPGRFQKILSTRRNQIDIRTDTFSTKKAIAVVTPKSFEQLHSIIQTLDDNHSFRLVLPIKKLETTMQMTSSFILVSGNPNINSLLHKLQSALASAKPIPASKSMKLFGDVLSRNQIQEEHFESDYQAAAATITSLLSTSWPSDLSTEDTTGAHQESTSDIMNSLLWREVVSRELSLAELPYQKDIVIFVDKLPVRVDFQSNNWLFFILFQVKQLQFNWFYRKICRFLEGNETKEIVFLLAQPKDRRLSHGDQVNQMIANRIHVIRNRQELVSLLKEKKGQIQQQRASVAQVA